MPDGSIQEPAPTPAAPSPDARPRERAVPILLAFVTLCNLVFVWAFPWFISQDGGAHVYNAWVLLHFFDSGYEFNRLYYELNPAPVPNLLSHAILVSLLTLLSPAAAEKALVSLYVILWPIAWVYALRAVRRDAAWLAALTMPLCMNWFLHMGFYNFCLSIGLFLLAFGYWLRQRRRPGPRRLAVFGALSLILYSAHLVSFGEFWIAAGGVEAGLFLRRRRFRRARPIAQLWRESAPWALAALPALVLSAWFILRPRVSLFPTEAPIDLDPGKLLRFFGPFPGVRAILFNEDLPATALQLAFAATFFGALFARLRRRGSRPADGLLVATAAAFALFMVLSNELGGGYYILHRLQFFVWLMALLWLASQPMGRPVRLALQGLGAGLALMLLALRIGPCVGITSQQREYMTLFDRIPAGASVLPLVATVYPFEPPNQLLSIHTFPLVHAAGRAAIERRFVYIANYEANTDHFPLRWREGLNTDKTIGRILAPMGRLEISRYGGIDGRGCDYITIWNNGGGEDQSLSLPYVMMQVRPKYRLVGVTQPRGFGAVYERNDPARSLEK
jgi:hypothetical protein